MYIVNCTFGSAERYGNSSSNDVIVSSIGVSWTIINSLFSHNEAIGNGGNPAQQETPGGGSGGAICNKGITMTLNVLGTKTENNEINAYGVAIFFVSNNHSGNIKTDQCSIKNKLIES